MKRGLIFGRAIPFPIDTHHETNPITVKNTQHLIIAKMDSIPQPTTPLRRQSESRVAEHFANSKYDIDNPPLETVFKEPLEELSAGYAQLNVNLQNLQQVHESMTSFNESFSAILYGLHINAWCFDFPEGPDSMSFAYYKKIKERIERQRELEEQRRREELERQRQRELELQREREREMERQRQLELQEQQKQQQRVQGTKRNLKRPTDYTPKRPTYGRPPQTKLKKATQPSTRGGWK